MNNIYTKLSGIKFLSKSYSFKFLFIAFLGIHIPLIGLIIFMIFRPGSIPASTVFIATLIFTLASTAVTLYILNSLLSPLKVSKAALDSYINERKLPSLPVIYKDEAGILMQRVQETVIKLDGLLEQKKDLIGLLSHDLRTPLANIRMLGRVIVDEGITKKELKDISELICDSADQQISIFHEILEILKQDDLDWVKMKLTETTTSVIIQSALKDVQHLADNKGVSLQVNDHYAGGLAVETNIFPQVIKNLLNNSIKFSHPGSVVSFDVSKPNGKIKMIIKDDGIGFNPEDAELLFQKFTTKRKKGTSGEATTGMGLYLSRKIIEAHKGKLYASSKGVNHGSSFTIEI